MTLNCLRSTGQLRMMIAKLRRFAYQFQPVWWGWKDRQRLGVWQFPAPEAQARGLRRIFTTLSLGVVEVRYWHGERPRVSGGWPVYKDKHIGS